MFVTGCRGFLGAGENFGMATAFVHFTGAGEQLPEHPGLGKSCWGNVSATALSQHTPIPQKTGNNNPAKAALRCSKLFCLQEWGGWLVPQQWEGDHGQ